MPVQNLTRHSCYRSVATYYSHDSEHWTPQMLRSGIFFLGQLTLNQQETLYLRFLIGYIYTLYYMKIPN